MAERYKKRGDRTNEGNGATPSKKRTATGSAVKHRSGAQGGAPAMPDENGIQRRLPRYEPQGSVG
jgi:hypothetical protein